MTGTKRGRGGLLACALLAGAVLAGSTSMTSPRAASKAVVPDIEIAIDTTGSMGYSITQAKADAKGLVSDIRARYSSARFAVTQFRDYGDTPEYQLMQAMTSNATAVDTAIDGLSAGGGGDSPEAHNLVFQNAIDPANAIGWRTGARRILVVISDAEPHGAGTAGFKGCTDTSADPHGFNTATVLASLKAAGVTLLMVRQAGGSATLECYQSLAAAGYRGGAARDSGNKLVDVVEAMIVKAVTNTAQIRFNFSTYAKNVRVLAPLKKRWQLGVARMSGSGVLSADGKKVVSGSIRDTDRNTSPRRNYGVKLKIISGKRTIVGGRAVLKLVVAVRRTNHAASCPVRTRGLITVIDNEALLTNGKNRDSVKSVFPRAGGPRKAPDRGAACRTHVHGWNNADGGARTSPPTGGPPAGGQWAKVTISR